MTDTRVPSSSRKENASRLTVELYADGQHDDRRQEAEPHKQDAWAGKESQPGLSCTFPYYETLGSLGREDNQSNACTACKHSGWEQRKQTHKRQGQNGRAGRTALPLQGNLQFYLFAVCKARQDDQVRRASESLRVAGKLRAQQQWRPGGGREALQENC